MIIIHEVHTIVSNVYCDFCRANHREQRVLTVLTGTVYKNNRYVGQYYFCSESCMNCFLLKGPTR